MKLQYLYLTTAVLGAVLPYYELYPFLAEEGLDLIRFGELLFANAVSGMSAIDLIVSSLVFWIWMENEGRQRGIRRRWAYVLANLTVGLSLALPLFLYVRERKTAIHRIAGHNGAA